MCQIEAHLIPLGSIHPNFESRTQIRSVLYHRDLSLDQFRSHDWTYLLVVRSDGSTRHFSIPITQIHAEIPSNLDSREGWIVDIPITLSSCHSLEVQACLCFSFSGFRAQHQATVDPMVITFPISLIYNFNLLDFLVPITTKLEGANQWEVPSECGSPHLDHGSLISGLIEKANQSRRTKQNLKSNICTLVLNEQLTTNNLLQASQHAFLISVGFPLTDFLRNQSSSQADHRDPTGLKQLLFLLVMPKHSDSTKQQQIHTLLQAQQGSARLTAAVPNGPTVTLTATYTHDQDTIQIQCDINAKAYKPLLVAAIRTKLCDLIQTINKEPPKNNLNPTHLEQARKVLSQLNDQIGKINYAIQQPEKNFDSLFSLEVQLGQIRQQLTQVYLNSFLSPKH